MTFEYALSPWTRLGSLPDPGETASNLSPKADSALKLSDTAYPGGPPPGLITVHHVPQGQVIGNVLEATKRDLM